MTAQRHIPSVDSLLKQPAVSELVNLYGHVWTVEAIRQVLDQLRSSPELCQSLTTDSIIVTLRQKLESQASFSIKPVINATGVLLHTNLGRAPLSEAGFEAIGNLVGAYSNLEFDLSKGSRGNRSIHATQMLKQLLGVESALVVNNNAGAVLLILSALVKGKKVAISRSQLIEIGGGFRIPEVMRQSGAKLYEVGATNRTHLSDYAAALDDGAQMILLAHPSNFKISGFTAQPELHELIDLARQYQVPLVYDLGSGALLDTSAYGIAREPTVQEILAAGADLVCFSGDKLLGGPQSGIIVGRQTLIARLNRHPLYRALRPDKLILITLSAVLLSYLRGKADSEIPLYQMLSRSLDELKQTAQEVLRQLGQGELQEGQSTIGGGSLPEESLPTWLVAFSTPLPEKLCKSLREQQPPVIARIQKDQVVCDLRTIRPKDLPVFTKSLEKALIAIKEKHEK